MRLMTVTNSKNLEFYNDIHEETVFLGLFYAFIEDSREMTGNEAEGCKTDPRLD